MLGAGQALNGGSDDFALVRTSGKRAARSGRATGPIGGSEKSGKGA